jgi:peptidyl-tRNA hydrolase
LLTTKSSSNRKNGIKTLVDELQVMMVQYYRTSHGIGSTKNLEPKDGEHLLFSKNEEKFNSKVECSKCQLDVHIRRHYMENKKTGNVKYENQNLKIQIKKLQ